jgi:hypothetical protein
MGWSRYKFTFTFILRDLPKSGIFPYGRFSMAQTTAGLPEMLVKIGAFLKPDTYNPL